MEKVALEKACDWLNNKTQEYRPVVNSSRYGYAAFIAYVFKIQREGKTSLFFVLELDKKKKITRIKRICLY